jgi:hypothetical protein
MQRVEKSPERASRAYALLCEVIDHMPIVMLARGAWSAWSERRVDRERGLRVKTNLR